MSPETLVICWFGDLLVCLKAPVSRRIVLFLVLLFCFFVVFVWFVLMDFAYFSSGVFSLCIGR